MKQLLFALVAIAATEARAHDVRWCHDAGIGIATLVTPVAKNVRTFYNNLVQIYNVDTIEPAAASAGIAVVLPDVDSPLGGLKCLAITNFAKVDVMQAGATYDATKGLSVSIPTKVHDLENGRSKRGAPLNIVINLKDSSVAIQ
jgi:hypothetical protein